VLIGSEKVADQATTPGMVLPSCIHGGPGRAGGGEELGGVRGMALYMQRSAVQGYQPWLEKLP
jgi:oxepin-CoA hydrolase/3-oxo-5,6-dehydrosuberyl-CoA semialdehyde dehydrogenase